jgi:hypothetical protein
VVLERDGETTIVQVKHWRRDRVGVALVRELYGVQRATGAERSTLVCLGRYTADARQFADSVDMRLVDGHEPWRSSAADSTLTHLSWPCPWCSVCRRVLRTVMR